MTYKGLSKMFVMKRGNGHYFLAEKVNGKVNLNMPFAGVRRCARQVCGGRQSYDGLAVS